MSAKIIAHRGASAVAPENTLVAIKAAAEAGADWVEWDTRVTADGVLILQHDETLEKYLGKKGRVEIEKMKFEESQTYDVGWWFAKSFEGARMPSLQQAIEASLPKMLPLIERKSGSAQQHVEVIRKMKVEDQVVVQAFDWKFLKQLRQLAPEIKMGALGSKAIKEKQFKQLFELKPEYVGWGSGDLKRSDVERFHAKGIKVLVWTVDAEKEIRKFIEWGVDGIITNDPANTREVVEE
ncbi:MAG: glycerophosphodiester phosphodiesterase family protein [Verrucomicrobiota bacterium]